MGYRVLVGLSIFAGGLAYTLLPHGSFGAYDVASRAAVSGTVAAVTCLVLSTLRKRQHRARR